MKQMNLIQLLNSKKRTVVIAALTATLVCLICYKLFAPLSPEAIRDLAISALEKRDAKELCRLADPQELTRLHLTPTIVDSFLHETLWSEDTLMKARFQKLTPNPDDQSVWAVHWDNEKKDAKKLVVFVVDDQKIGWKLILSRMLCISCWRNEGGKLGMKTYYSLADKYGINGMRVQGGGYQSKDDLAKEIRNVFGE